MREWVSRNRSGADGHPGDTGNRRGHALDSLCFLRAIAADGDRAAIRFHLSPKSCVNRRAWRQIIATALSASKRDSCRCRDVNGFVRRNVEQADVLVGARPFSPSPLALERTARAPPSCRSVSVRPVIATSTARGNGQSMALRVSSVETRRRASRSVTPSNLLTPIAHARLERLLVPGLHQCLRDDRRPRYEFHSPAGRPTLSGRAIPAIMWKFRPKTQVCPYVP